MYHLCFYVPVEAAEKVKQAVFAAGAGKIGEYEACCWQTEGIGQFKPSLNAQPAIGEKAQVNRVTECKIELVCSDERIKAAVLALLAAHPYEEPAYHCFPVHSLADL